MIEKLALDLTSYIEINSNIKSKEDLEKINYSIKVLIGEGIKIFFLLLIFTLLGKMKIFLFSMVIFCSIRAFAGGLHFSSVLKCFLSSLLIFILSTVIVPHYVPMLDTKYYIALGILSLVLIFIFSPKPSRFRPIKDKKRRWNIKLISTFIALFYLVIIYFFIKDISYINCGIFTILLQSIQLINIKE